MLSSVTMRIVLASIAALVLVSCSTPAPMLRNVPVEYRFENVRVQPGTDEWDEIQKVLKRHVKTPVTGEVMKERVVGDAKIRSYKAQLVVANLAVVDAIHTDLEALRRGTRGGGRMDFRLGGLGATYQSSFVTAGVSTVVSGFTVDGNDVRVYVRPGAEAIKATTTRGLWVAKLEGAPEDRWVYGISEHPRGALPRRYFRVNVTTLKTDNLDESEFAAWYGAAPK